MATAVNGWHWGVDFIKARNVESYNKKDKNTLFANKITVHYIPRCSVYYKPFRRPTVKAILFNRDWMAWEGSNNKNRPRFIVWALGRLFSFVSSHFIILGIFSIFLSFTFFYLLLTNIS